MIEHHAEQSVEGKARVIPSIYSLRAPDCVLQDEKGYGRTGYAKGDFSPVEATRAALERIEVVQPLVNAFVRFM